MAFIGLGDKVAVVEEMEEILELRGDIEEVAIIKAYHDDDWTRALIAFFQNPSDPKRSAAAAKRNRKVELAKCSLHSSGLLVLQLSASRTATVLPFCAATLAIRTYLIDQVHRSFRFSQSLLIRQSTLKFYRNESVGSLIPLIRRRTPLPDISID